MLFGTSYSLIMNNIVSEETVGFNVANFDVSFNDDTSISLSSIPMSDEEGLKNSKEYTFNIDNNSDYDINYRLDIIENGLNMGEVIHYAYKINDESYSKVYVLKDNYTIKQNKVLEINQSDIYKVKIWLSDEADETYMNKSFSASIVLNATQNEYKYASSVMEKLANNHQDNVVKEGNEYYYSTNDSPNYVWFNCENGFTKGNDYCEKWRIIGSFKNKSEKSVEEFYSLKIVSTKEYDNLSYNSDEDNDFSKAYISSYANGYFYDSMSDNTKKLILKAKWDIGDILSNDYQSALKDEKNNTFYANIGLVNVSDYLYLKEENFFPNNMMFLNKTNGKVNVLDKNIQTGNNENSYLFVPCIYLRGDVSIVSGDGNIDNPYELMIKYPLNY